MHGPLAEAPAPPSAPSPLSRGLTKLWMQRPPIGVTADAGVPLVDRVLAARGFDSRAAAQDFLSPALRQLHDPSLIPGLDRAAARIHESLAAGERVVIYGDYDVDGITATAILYHTCRAIAPACTIGTYVPHRLEEGYGLNAAALVDLAREGTRLVVSVDCGVTAIDAAAAARTAGLDLIITDHHNPPREGEGLPAAYAIVHPRLPGSPYPFAHLSGAGVAYKLAWRLVTMHCRSPRVTDQFRSLLLELLAFAALGTIADVVPLTGENRVLARYGLGRIKHSPFPGLRALVEASGLAGENVDAEDVGFKLAPRLNACGRMGHAREAVELFTTAQGEAAAEIAKSLCRLNDQRRATEAKIADQAAEAAQRAGMTDPGRRAIVLAHEEWHQGVVGIVCSRLVDRFCRPTILMQRRPDGQCHGSGRSIEGFSLHGALAECAAHLSGFGGHDMAAGVRVEGASLDAFADAFTVVANREIPADRLMPCVKFDCDATLAELTTSAVQELNSLAPFGPGNPRPRLRLSRLRLSSRPEVMGAAAKHLSLLVRQGQSTMRMVAWNYGQHQGHLAAGMEIDAVVSPKLSSWTGRWTVEPELEDLSVLGARQE